MELKQINELISNLENASSNTKLQFIERREIHKGVTDYEGVSGEENTYHEIYKIKSETDLYLQIEYFTDSYGENEAPRGAKFVKKGDKVITIYNPI